MNQDKGVGGMDDKIEKKISKLYRDEIMKAVRSPEVKREKREFLDAHFRPERPVWIRPQVFVPAFSVIGIVTVMFLLQYMGPYTGPSVKQAVPVAEPIAPQPVFMKKEVPEKIPDKTQAVSDKLVEVKWATSRVGPTMVYQKMYQDVPVTIIWVFAGGNGK